MLFSNRGLIVGAPIVLVGLVAAAWLAISGSAASRRHAVVALAVTVPYLVLCGLVGFSTLEYPGPRYLIPALPFFAAPLAAAWDRLWRPAVLFGLFGAVVSLPAATTFILLGIKQPPFPELFRRVGAHEFLPTLWSMAFGRVGVVLYVASVAACVALLLASLRRAGALATEAESNRHDPWPADKVEKSPASSTRCGEQPAVGTAGRADPFDRGGTLRGRRHRATGLAL